MHTPPHQPTRALLRREPFPEFLMDIANSADANCLQQKLDMITDDALNAAVDAVHAPGTIVCELCDALRWVAREGTVQAITSVSGVWTPTGLLLTATATVAAGGKDVRVVEHIPLARVHAPAGIRVQGP